MHNLSIFIFRRDLRLNDNIGLIEALKNSKSVIPIFIFDPRQIEKNEYKSDNAIQFMLESIKDLHVQLKKKNAKLYLFYGISEEVIKKLLITLKIDALFLNRDYTPFSLKRDEAIRHFCNKNGVQYYQFNDLLLTEPEEVLTANFEPYTIFTPFFKKALKKQILRPNINKYDNFYKNKIKEEIDDKILKKILPELNKQAWVNGGRSKALKILKDIYFFANYENEKDYPIKTTTNLSAYLKFGCCSIREVYYAIKDQLGDYHPLIRQLFWRDFYTHIVFNSPFVLGQSFKQKYNNLNWNYDKKLFKLWCEGKTGFPIIDAGMRQLNQTGFMHNRVRMITASFLVKDLHIDWRLGEKYFATKLIDYDPAVNNGNWQWCASTGADAQPYFRIFNPWLQQKKFDAKCEYIKTWIPELKNIEPKVIHKIYENQILGYPRPIIDHSVESKIAIKIYKDI